MANVIKHKRGSGSDPVASDLVVGEVAIRTDVGKLFTKMDNGTVAEIAGGGSDIAINTLSSSSGTGGGSATFNGSAYRFTLSAPPSVSAQQLLVSINGVIQKPVAGTGQPSEGFSVDGTDIILGDAPATGSDFFILTFKSLGVSEPADNSVTSAKIVDGAIVNADINASAAIAGSKISPIFTSATEVQNSTFKITDSNPEILLAVPSGGLDSRIINDGSGNLIIGHGVNSDTPTERLRMDSSGNVGIGTQNPSSALEVSRASGDTIFELNRSNSNITGNVGCINFTASDGHSVGSIGMLGDGDDQGGDLVFRTTTAAANNSPFNAATPERMRIDSSGLVKTITRSAEVRRMILAGSPTNGAFNIEAHDGETGTSAGDVQGKLGLFYNDGTTLSNTANLSFERGSGAADGAIAFVTNQTERMRIDSSGHLLVNTTSVGGGSYDQLSVAGGIKITDDSNSKLEIGRYSSSSTNSYIKIGSNSDSLRITNAADSSDLFTFTNDGKVGIGTTSPAQLLEIHGASNPAVLLKDTTNNVLSYLYSQDLVGAVGTASNHPFVFNVNNGEKMRIDTSGNVGIGTTATSMNGNGLKIYHTNFPSLQLQNNATGTGATVGAEFILSSGGALQIVQRSSEATIFKTQNTERMRILAGGGLTFNGDTAAANALDDYEEGTFTPDWKGGSALGSSITYGTTNAGSYTKIGRLVTVTGRTDITGGSGALGFWFCTNMPFVVNSGGKGFNAVGSISLENNNFGDDVIDVVVTMEQNNNNMHIHGVRDNASLSNSISPSNDYDFSLQFTITYQTA